MWYHDLVKLLETNKMEMMRMKVGQTEEILFVGPRLLNEDEQKEIIALLPEEMRGRSVEFQMGLKQSTAQAMSILLSMAGVSSLSGMDLGQTLILNLTTTRELDKELWDRLDDLLYRDGYLNGWTVVVNDRELYQRTHDEINRRRCQVKQEGPLFMDELDAVKSKYSDYLAPDPEPNSLEHAAQVAEEERLAHKSRTHPPSLDEIEKLRKFLDQCDDSDLIRRIL